MLGHLPFLRLGLITLIQTRAFSVSFKLAHSRSRSLTSAGHPLVKFVGPILERVDWDDDENPIGLGVAQKAINEGDHLEGLSQTHAMRQDATKPLAFLELR